MSPADAAGAPAAGGHRDARPGTPEPVPVIDAHPATGR
jgi:hypothetical protein